MTNYGIFDFLYSELRHTFENDNFVFTQKYLVGKQRIRIYCFKDKKNDLVVCLHFLNKLQRKYVCCSDWSPFYFSRFKNACNILFYPFLSKNEEEIRRYEHFCCLGIS